MKLPKHYILSIEHNPHKSFYQTVEEYIYNFDRFKSCITEEDFVICVDRDELWYIQWYPNTPISFNLVISYSLERCIEIINEDLYDYS